jgi:dTDP-4-amino-4,6-dideoxygalactose transaminase
MAGGLAHAAAFSFYPGKNLGAFGDGGAITTDDEKVAETARRLRAHGSVDRYIHAETGYNSRLDELQAAALRVLLPHLDGWTEARRRCARLYAESELAGALSIPRETPGAAAAYHLYVVMTPRRDELHAALETAGIETRAYYTTPLHRQPAFGSTGNSVSFPNAERLAAEGLALPMGPALRQESVLRVAIAVAEALAAVRR